MEQNLVSVGYDAVYEATPKSPTLRRLWREHASGADFPARRLPRTPPGTHCRLAPMPSGPNRQRLGQFSGC